MNQQTDVADDVIDSALALAAEEGWRSLSMSRIAAAADVPLTEIYRHFQSKMAILEGLTRRIDAAVLEGGSPDDEDSVRDRIFDLLMRRFDALNAQRAGIIAVVKDLPADPLAALAQLSSLERAMAWTLDLAGDQPDGFMGQIKVRALGLIYLLVLRTWVDDDSPDMAKTMATLDRRLSQAEQLAGFVLRRERRAKDSDEGKEASNSIQA